MDYTRKCVMCNGVFDTNTRLLLCTKCEIISALLDAQTKMYYASRLMIHQGGDYEAHGREMKGAARTIEGWLNEIG
jgi:hypothetical protein